MVAESYDEIVFADPRPPFHAQLLGYGSSTSTSNHSHTSHVSSGTGSGNGTSSSSGGMGRKPTAFPEHYLAFDEAADLEVLAAIYSHLKTEIARKCLRKRCMCMCLCSKLDMCMCVCLWKCCMFVCACGYQRVHVCVQPCC
ncbi:hypothetical protein EON63_09745 [archaeon]|nr:MAG: hypothetical protein EON63_09745 [archaeon]